MQKTTNKPGAVMAKQWTHNDQDSLLEDLIRTCNDMQDTSRRALQGSTAHASLATGYCGPLRWQQSCDQTIAVPRQTLRFRLELNTTSSADFDDVFNVRLHRTFSESLIYDHIASVLVDGQPARPTNHSLSRTLDLAFNRIVAGSTVIVTYEARVRFDAEPCSIPLDDVQLQWSWVSRSRKLVAHNKHVPLPSTHVDRAAVSSLAAAKSV